MSAKDTRAAAIVAELQRRYPCQAIPYGSLSEIGEQFGVSRERVRQLANKHGWSGRIPRQGPGPRGCKVCGQATHRPQSPYCNEHKDVALVCEECGCVFRMGHSRLRARLRSRTVHGRYYETRVAPQFYCSKTCFGKAFGRAYGVGRPKAVAS